MSLFDSVVADERILAEPWATRERAGLPVGRCRCGSLLTPTDTTRSFGLVYRTVVCAHGHEQLVVGDRWQHAVERDPERAAQDRDALTRRMTGEDEP